jgi:exodeoxyribonuclease-1
LYKTRGHTQGFVYGKLGVAMNEATFYFYDTETSGASPKRSRIMQFAGQRTDMQMNPIGEADDILIKLSPDVLPEPDAVLIHRITPQQANSEGMTERDFLNYFFEHIATPSTIFVGYNSVRFDDEFMRHLCYRNFFDPYEWHWKDGRSRWDLLDPMRMMRALRPKGLQWPTQDGKPTVSLESLASENKLVHSNAHNALSDVEALVQLAKKFQSSQPKLFDYLLDMRDKRKVATLVGAPHPFVYTSGKYSGDFLKTTVVLKIADHPKGYGAFVWDLRYDPRDLMAKTPKELAEMWLNRDKGAPRLPIKTLLYNRCPAVAPISVLDESSYDRIALDKNTISKNLTNCVSIIAELTKKVVSMFEIVDGAQQAAQLSLPASVDEQLYDGFWNDSEYSQLKLVQSSAPNELSTTLTQLKSKRLRELLPLYKARNFASILSPKEKKWWNDYCVARLTSGGEKSMLAQFYNRLSELSLEYVSDSQASYLLTELQLYAESLVCELELE